MACTPSARLSERFPDPPPSKYAKEGTLAHEFAEVELRYFNGEIDEKEHRRLISELEKSEFYTDEMDDEVAKYVDYIKQQFTEVKRKHSDAILLIEDRIDLTRFIEGGFGTNDALIICDGTMEVTDLKYGKGVYVDATENPQLMLYGLGALYQNMLLYDIRNVRLTVVQPRLDSISSWEISSEDLLDWGLNTVAPLAEKAHAGEGELVPGDHCRWCKVKPRCPALAEQNLEIAKHEFQAPELLSDQELVEVYKKADQISDWLKSVGEYMLAQALEGKEWEGYKLVEGRSNRKWSDEEKAIEVLVGEGFDRSEVTQTKLKGVAKIEKLVGKKRFPTLLDAVVVKPAGKPTLVPADDKRPAMGNKQAAVDFQT